MQSENCVLFKVFVTDGNNDPEVRRFSVDRGAVTSFEYMKAKIQSVFPTLKNKSFTLTWKDDEGDDVLISSDEELILALSNTQGDLKKLYVKRSAPKVADVPFMDIPITITSDCFGAPPQPSGSAGRKRAFEGSAHPSVVCDSCNGPVVGFRYKCVICDDFDLCATCEGKNVHSEHFMFRIPVPVGYLGHRFTRVIHKVLKKSGMLNVDYGAAGECPYTTKRHCKDTHAEGGESRHGRHGSKGRHSKRAHHEDGRKHHEEGRQHSRSERHCHRMGNGGWLNTVTAYMNEFANLAGDIGSQAAAAASAHAGAATSATATTFAAAPTTQSSEQPSAPQQPSPSGDSAQNGNVPPSSAQAAHDLHVQYLRNVGRTVAKILDPLGIDVDIEVRPKSNETDDNNKSQASQSTEAGHPKPNGAGDKESPVIEINDGSSSSSDSDSSDSDSGRRPEGWTFVGPKDSAHKKAEENSRKIGFDLEKMAQQFQKNMEIHAQGMKANMSETTPQAQSTGIYPTIPLPDASAPMDIVPEVENVVVTPPKVTSPPPAPIPQQVSAPTTSRPLRPEIAESYNRMLAMGFKDDGGRLIRLLESKHGNISEVLDVLSMNIPKS